MLNRVCAAGCRSHNFWYLKILQLCQRSELVVVAAQKEDREAQAAAQPEVVVSEVTIWHRLQLDDEKYYAEHRGNGELHDGASLVRAYDKDADTHDAPEHLHQLPRKVI